MSNSFEIVGNDSSMAFETAEGAVQEFFLSRDGLTREELWVQDARAGLSFSLRAEYSDRWTLIDRYCR